VFWKIVRWSLVALLVYMIAYRSETTALIAQRLMTFMATTAQGIGDFLSSLVT
jgi:hypothetical protein